MKPIVHIPNAILSTVAKDVKVFDKKLQKILIDMKEALVATKNPKGVGLAAPQIGLSLRIFITKPNDKADIRAFINPHILDSKMSENTEDPLREALRRGMVRWKGVSPSQTSGESPSGIKYHPCLS